MQLYHLCLCVSAEAWWSISLQYTCGTFVLLPIFCKTAYRQLWSHKEAALISVTFTGAVCQIPLTVYSAFCIGKQNCLKGKSWTENFKCYTVHSIHIKVQLNSEYSKQFKVYIILQYIKSVIEFFFSEEFNHVIDNHTYQHVHRCTSTENYDNMCQRERLSFSLADGLVKGTQFDGMADMFANNTVISPRRAKHASVCLLIPHKRAAHSFSVMHT